MNIRQASQVKVDEITDFVKQKVDSGEWQPGSQMPTEKILIEQFSAARNTVRKALAKLENQNVIEKFVGKGTFIKHAQSAPHESTTNADWIDASPAEINEIRVLLEPSIAELVVARGTMADIAQAKTCLENTLKAQSLEEFEKWDAELHNTIIRATKNNMVILIYNTIHQARQKMEWHEIKRRSLSEERIQNYHSDHKNIVDAFAMRDPVALRTALLTHLKDVSHNMLHPE